MHFFSDNYYTLKINTSLMTRHEFPFWNCFYIKLGGFHMSNNCKNYFVLNKSEFNSTIDFRSILYIISNRIVCIFRKKNWIITSQINEQIHITSEDKIKRTTNSLILFWILFNFIYFKLPIFMSIGFFIFILHFTFYLNCPVISFSKYIYIIKIKGE